ncbi:MAG: hypothetical protein LBP89_09305 [Helicobacteraceae bacterium]|jgi:hypothetical protein|nr:hypothetical protein [Helicobacteraceae bacterium]
MRSALFIVLFACFLVGCAPYSNSFAKIENGLKAGDAQGALSALESSSPADRDRVLYELNRAMILQDLGRYKDSAAAFEAAKTLFQEYDAISVSEQIGSSLINDSTISYFGADFERVMASFYAAINYLLLGDLYGARVEIMQGDERLKAIDAGEYQDDAALRYLSGVVFEALGENNNALVSYRQAYRVYKEGFFGVRIPNYLKNDLLRLSKKMGVAQEHNLYKSEFGLSGDFNAIGSTQGELVAILGGGFAPIKRASDVMFSSAVGIIRISIPRYELRLFAVPPPVLIDGVRADFELVESVAAIALETLKDDMPEIMARTAARMIAKKGVEIAVGQTAGNNDAAAGVIARAIVNLFNATTEVADTRGWYTLPDSIYIARVRLNSGAHKVVIGTKEYNIEIRSGERTFLAPRLY